MRSQKIKNPSIGFEVRKVFVLSGVIFGVLQLLEGLYQPEHACDNLWMSLGYTLLYTFSLYFVNATLFRYFNARYADNPYTPQRILWRLLTSLTASMGVILLLRLWQDVGVRRHAWVTFWQQEQLTNYIVPMVITVMVTLTMHAVYIYKAFLEHQIHIQELKASAMTAQYESLKDQIDPHFLFNSLNVLSALIEENPEKAAQFTTALSRIYRYVLDQKTKTTVPLQEEITFARAYIQLLEMRFENSIQCTLDVPVTAVGEVVPLSLQLLLENAIKHNSASPEQPLKIRIGLENNQLVVHNQLQAKTQVQNRKGVGLSHIRQRYAWLTAQPIEVVHHALYYEVRLPLLASDNAKQPESKPIERAQTMASKSWITLTRLWYTWVLLVIGGLGHFLFQNGDIEWWGILTLSAGALLLYAQMDHQLRNTKR